MADASRSSSTLVAEPPDRTRPPAGTALSGSPAPYHPKTWLRVVVALTTLGMIGLNSVAGSVGLFGRGTGDISDRFPTLVTPAGYVFAIWGLIYVGLLVYTVAQFLRPLRTDPLPDRLAWPLVASNVFNSMWLLLWHSLNIYLTVPVMIALLVSLIIAHQTARRGRPERPAAVERWAVRAPLGLYLGWISVATIANISNALVAAKWDGSGLAPWWWGVAVLIVGTVLAFAVLARDGDCVYAAVFVWAYMGIRAATPSPLIATTVTVLALSIAVGLVGSAIIRRRLV